MVLEFKYSFMLHVPLRKVLALSTIFEAFTTYILHRLAPTFFPKLPDFPNSDLGHFPFPENMIPGRDEKRGTSTSTSHQQSAPTTTTISYQQQQHHQKDAST
jgi:hypothetical protein